MSLVGMELKYPVIISVRESLKDVYKDEPIYFDPKKYNNLTKKIFE